MIVSNLVNKSFVNTTKNANVDNSSTDDFFLLSEVVNGCHISINHRFETLSLSKNEHLYEWYKSLGLDKGYASRIRRGLIIPPEPVRLKIANYFGVDSSVIWRPEEIVKFEEGKNDD